MSINLSVLDYVCFLAKTHTSWLPPTSWAVPQSDLRGCTQLTSSVKPPNKTSFSTFRLCAFFFFCSRLKSQACRLRTHNAWPCPRSCHLSGTHPSHNWTCTHLSGLGICSFRECESEDDNWMLPQRKTKWLTVHKALSGNMGTSSPWLQLGTWDTSTELLLHWNPKMCCLIHTKHWILS